MEKNFYMMFNAMDGGVVESVSFNKEQLQPKRSIIILDESTQKVYLWHGKLQSLVGRRTALRQAQSLKGHGYTVGHAIIGRTLNSLTEIDDRKVGRVDEDTNSSKEMMSLFSSSYSNTGNNIYVQGEGGDSVEEPEPKVEPKKEEPKPKVESKPEPKVEPKKEEPKPKVESKPEPKVEPKKEEPKPKVESKPAPVESITSDALKEGAFIVAVLNEYKDIWISKKDDGSIMLEQMDGKIASFAISNGKLDLKEGSFADVPADKKSAIESAYKKII